jgi:hypothetical protein
MGSSTSRSRRGRSRSFETQPRPRCRPNERPPAVGQGRRDSGVAGPLGEAHRSSGLEPPTVLQSSSCGSVG